MTINVVKLGGGAGVNHQTVLRNLAERIHHGDQWILVHGCSDAANQLAEQVGYPAQTITSPGGHTSRYTDARTLEIFSAAAGMVNQQLAAELMSYHVHAVGLSGPNVIRAERKKAIRAIRNGRQIIIRDDYSGKIMGINTQVLVPLLESGLTPVVAPLALGDEYERLNVDGDLAAAQIAHDLRADTLVILSNVPGLLRDVNDPASLISRFSLSELDRYADFAGGRMKKKLLAAAAAQVSRVILADSRLENPIDAALAGAGTHIVNEAVYAYHA
jgi:acetylglutamate/LysW-gamma-L-alpha-aminoadipate kinase